MKPTDLPAAIREANRKVREWNNAGVYRRGRAPTSADIAQVVMTFAADKRDEVLRLESADLNRRLLTAWGY